MTCGAASSVHTHMPICTHTSRNGNCCMAVSAAFTREQSIRASRKETVGEGNSSVSNVGPVVGGLQMNGQLIS